MTVNPRQIKNPNANGGLVSLFKQTSQTAGGGFCLADSGTTKAYVNYINNSGTYNLEYTPDITLQTPTFTNFLSVTNSGAFTLGPSGFGGTHTVNGILSATLAPGSVTAGMIAPGVLSAAATTNYLTNGTFQDDTPTSACLNWTATTATQVCTNTAGEVLFGTKSMKISCSAGGTGTVDSTTITITDPFVIGKPVYLVVNTRGLTVSGTVYVAGNITVEIYDTNASATVAGTLVSIPGGDYQVKCWFIPTAVGVYKVRFRTLTVANQAISVDNVAVTTQSTIYANNVTDWISYTGSLTYAGTTATNIMSQNYKYRRVGDTCYVQCRIYFSGAANANGQLQIPLPPGLVIDNAKLPNIYTLLGTAQFYTNAKGYFGTIFTDGANTGYVVIYRRDDSGAINAPWSGNTVAASNVPSGVAIVSSDDMGIEFAFPVVGWGSNIQIADRTLEEYAFNNSPNANTDTSSFGYGPSGVIFQAFAPTGLNSIVKYVKFQNTILPTDKISMEITRDGISWYPFTEFGMCYFENDAGTTAYGIQLFRIDSTTIQVAFYSKMSPSTAWSVLISSYYWRVRKTSGGAAVGFPIPGENVLPACSINRVITTASTIYYGNGITLLNSGTPFTATLVTAVGMDGKIIRLKNINTATVTVDGNASETIDGSLTLNLDAYESVDLLAYNGNWYII